MASSESKAHSPTVEEPVSLVQRLAEILFLLLFPVVAYFALNVPPRIQDGSIDPYVYTGYIHNFRDLLQRYDLTYYSVRFGFIWPGRLINFLFGADLGFGVLRYLLILVFGVPLYAVVKRHLSAPVAIVVYAAALGNPFLWRILLWDYVDSTGAPFLTAAVCLILLEQTPRRPWNFLAGACAAMAIHSNVFSITVFGIFLVVYLSLSLAYKRNLPALGWTLGMAAAGGLVITLAGVADYWVETGHPRNIFYPTYLMMVAQAPGSMDTWKLHDFAWVRESFHIWVPVWLAAGCVASVRKGWPFPIAVMTCFGAAATGFYYFHEFVLHAITLELPYYFSYLAPAIFLMLAVVCQQLWQRAQAAGWLFAVLGVALSIAPWVLQSRGFDLATERTLLFFEQMASATLVVLLILALWLRGPAPRVLALAGMVLIGAGLYSGFSTYFYVVRYYRDPATREIAVYRTALQLIDAVPKMQDHPGKILFWYTGRRASSINSVQSTFLWGFSRLQDDSPSDPGLPAISEKEVATLKESQERYLGLLSETAGDLPAGRQALTARGIRFRDTGPRELGSGEFRLYWDLLELQH